MAKVKPSLRSDEDSAVEFSRSASDSDQSPREDHFREFDSTLPNFYASDSEFSEDDGQSYGNVSSSAVSSSTRNMVQCFSTKVRSTSRRIDGRIENPGESTRKGRKRSIQVDESILEEELSRATRKDQSKNAINARINRIKKKKYMQSLEDNLGAYKNECKRWQSAYRQKLSEVQSLQSEVKYLKAVLRNESKLSELVKNFSYHGNVSQFPPKADTIGTESISLTVKGTNLSQTNNVNANFSYCNSCETPESVFDSDSFFNDSSIMNDFLNFETNSSQCDLGLPVGEGMTFKSVFPSACDFFNFDLPENVEESDLFTLGESAMDSDMSSSCEDVGICLHVSTVSGISMEFCSHCSKSTFPESIGVSSMIPCQES